VSRNCGIATIDPYPSSLPLKALSKIYSPSVRVPKFRR
jgi:hypothetical protein